MESAAVKEWWPYYAKQAGLHVTVTSEPEF